MTPFSAFLDLIGQIEDPRRAEGKLYRLSHIVLFTILASLAGANSYRSVHAFIGVHRARLRRIFGLKWRRAPAHTTIRWILQQLDPAGVESVLRAHAAALARQAKGTGHHIAIDGKTLRGSLDRFADVAPLPVAVGLCPRPAAWCLGR